MLLHYTQAGLPVRIPDPCARHTEGTRGFIQSAKGFDYGVVFGDAFCAFQPGRVSPISFACIKRGFIHLSLKQLDVVGPLKRRRAGTIFEAQNTFNGGNRGILMVVQPGVETVSQFREFTNAIS